MKTIELLLSENVDNLGIVGDVVKVKPGYARNYLLPHALATTPTEGNKKRLAARRQQVEEELKTRRVVQEQMIAKLQDYELTLERSANEQGILFGGVSQHDIAEALQAEGFEIDDRAVRIGEQIKRLDSYSIPIQVAEDLRTQIKLWVVSDKPAASPEGEKEDAVDEVEGEVVQEESEPAGTRAGDR